jgi:peptidoglycan/LPS O-acetylase OafA/YrhL
MEPASVVDRLERPAREAVAGGAVILSLTGVRAAAALWVVAHHLRLGAGRLLGMPEAADRLCHLGYLGVDLFGFLSGFVIAHNYARRLARPSRNELGRYLWLRAARIVPLHWFALGLLVAATAWLPDFGSRPGMRGLYRSSDLVLQFFLVHGWSLGNGFAWNLPSWTVSSEWLSYLLFPLLAGWIARQRDAAACALFAAASFGVTVVAMRALGHPDFNAAMHGGVVRIAGEFLTGCLLQRAFALGLAPRAPWGAISTAAGAAAVLLALAGVPVGVVAALAVLVIGLAHGRGALARVCSTRPVVFLGEASYAIYLMHWVVLVLLRWALPPRLAVPADTAAGWVALALQVAAILLVAIAVHVGFENPVRRRLRSMRRTLAWA